MTNDKKRGDVMKTDEAIKQLEFDRDFILGEVGENLTTQALSHAIEHMKRHQWRPIEEAPRDGTRIYGYDKNNGNCGVVALNSAGEWASVDGYGGLFDIGFYPTHFMPLPEFDGETK